MKRLVIGMLLLVSSQLVCADESFGRLFSTSKERANLDYLRQTRKIVVPQTVEPTASPVQVLALPKAVELQGITDCP